MRAKKSSSFLSMITGISLGGVAIGVLTLVVTLSVMNGFETELKKRLFNAEMHLLIESPAGFFKPERSVIDEIQKTSDKVREVTEVLETEAILRSGSKVSGAQLKGVSDNRLLWVKSISSELAPDELLKGVQPYEKVYMGQEMAFSVGAAAGDRITVVSPVENDGPFGAVPRVMQFVVAGIYKSGVPEQELHTVFTSIGGVETFIKQKDVINKIEVRLDGLDSAEKVAPLVEQKLIAIGTGYTVRSWQELNEHLFKSLKLERSAMFGILLFIVIVASFNIVSTLTMMVIEKKKSLSILRAMGATKKQISSIFLWEGLAIGLFGVGFGAGIGLLLCMALSKYQFIELPDYYYDRNLPVVIDPIIISVISVTAIIIVIIAALVPSKKAAELTPIDGIRD